MKIYKFHNNSNGFNFIVLADYTNEAWGLILERINENRNYYGWDDMLTERSIYTVKEIDLDDSKVLGSWK